MSSRLAASARMSERTSCELPPGPAICRSVAQSRGESRKVFTVNATSSNLAGMCPPFEPTEKAHSQTPLQRLGIPPARCGKLKMRLLNPSLRTLYTWNGRPSASRLRRTVRVLHTHCITTGHVSQVKSNSPVCLTERQTSDSDKWRSVRHRLFRSQPPQLARDRQEGNPDLLHIGVLVVTKSEPKDLQNLSDRCKFIHLTPPSTCIPRAPPLHVITLPTPQHERHHERHEHERTASTEHDAVHFR